MIGELGENLVFLLGLPRSGTTLLSVLLNQHPDVHCPSEPWLMLALEAMGRTPDTDPQDAAVLYHAMKEFLTDDVKIESTRAYARHAYNKKLDESGKRIFVDKTPRYYLILPFIHRVFPKARYLLLLRNPMDVAASMKHTWDFDLRHEFEHNQDALGSVDLNYGLRQMMVFACHKDHPAFFVRYEELVNEPREKMNGVFQYLDVKPSLAPAEAEFDIAKTSFAISSVGDRSILQTRSPHQKSVDAWKRAFDKDELKTILQGIGPRMMRDLQYGHTVDEIAAMGIDVGDESTALAHFKRQLDAVMWRVHKYMACATFAGLMPARDRLAEEMGVELPLDPMARVKALTERARQLKASADPATHPPSSELLQLRRQVEDLRMQNARLTASLTAASVEAGMAEKGSRAKLRSWMERSERMTRRVDELIKAWPLKLAWGLRMSRPPEWIWKWGHPEPDAVPQNGAAVRIGEPMYDALEHLRSKAFKPAVVLDIGAKGDWSEKTQARHFPDAEYFVIEPHRQTEADPSTLSRDNSRFHYLPMAIGSEPVDRLIEQGKLKSPDLVKLDVQGSELEVLKGGQRLLDSAGVFIIEVSLYEFTPGTPLIDRIMAYMAEKGFRMFDIAGTLRRPYQDDLAKIELVFVKNGLDLVSSNRWD